MVYHWTILVSLFDYFDLPVFPYNVRYPTKVTLELTWQTPQKWSHVFYLKAQSVAEKTDELGMGTSDVIKWQAYRLRVLGFLLCFAFYIGREGDPR